VSHKLADESQGECVEHFDVLIVGAGISGIGAAYHLQRDCPEMSFAVLDAHETFGGTWLIHTYPGARSDSDLFTFGYGFKPWKGAPIATRAQILSYLGEVIEENSLEDRMRYRHTIRTAAWSDETNLWTLEVSCGEDAVTTRYTTRFLWMCQGYYRHSEGFTPNWAGLDSYKGRLVHPQRWPQDLEYPGKKVLIIGSGATAATLVPAIADQCSHVTMLQRTPTYFATGRNADALADELRRLGIDDQWVHEILRRKVVHDRAALMQRAQEEPDALKEQLLEGVRVHLGADFDVDKHFTPPYRPMQQRVAFIPDADLFKAIRAGKASVVTDEIERFTEKGVLLKSGQSIEADIVVTATGFNISLMGDIRFSINGKLLVPAESVTYRGIMLTGVPNFAWIYGYNVYSWTLRSDLVAQFVSRLLQHMRASGHRRVTPTLRPEDADMQVGPWVNPDKFSPGYLMRSRHLFPQRGEKPEWQHSQDYVYESGVLPQVDLDDPLFQYL
jgi:cation diffusion facilitator CzcD-associated flavoprotein CzcO